MKYLAGTRQSLQVNQTIAGAAYLFDRNRLRQQNLCGTKSSGFECKGLVFRANTHEIGHSACAERWSESLFRRRFQRFAPGKSAEPALPGVRLGASF